MFVASVREKPEGGAEVDSLVRNADRAQFNIDDGLRSSFSIVSCPD
jgi:hypothetical protein